MATKNVLAIDFGTANSYYCKCPGNPPPRPSGVDFRTGTVGLATAILYRQGEASLVGHVAIEEYGNASQQERRQYTLRMHFKPDIAASAEAKRNTHDFLTAVLEEAKSLKLDIDPARRQVIFGVPSEAGADFRKALSEAAKDAGYGKIRMVDEPKGALLYHVFHEDLPATDALKGLLVVDFGGGTCDFAFMCRGSVRYSWGDMHLGGRLFDDLFFQWFLEANPDALDTLRGEGREFYVLWKECRDKKESFSQSMSRDRTQKRTLTVDRRWKIAEATWEDFVRRAGSYRPSPLLTQFLASMGALRGKFNGPNANMDLLGWFRDCLRQGLRDGRIDKSDIRFVILAGGSSQWPFVVDIVREELGIEESRIMRSDEPYVAIAEGLAVLPALQAKLGQTQERLKAELPTFCREKLRPLLEKRSVTVARGIASQVVGELFDERIKPTLLKFREEGGAIASLKQQIISAAKTFEPRLKAILDERKAVLTEGLPTQIRELVSGWLKDHGIAFPEVRLAAVSLDTGQIGGMGDPVDVYDGIASRLAALAVTIPAAIAAMICGGGGTAIIMSGPIGWLIGLILTAVIGYLAIKHGLKAARRMAEEWRIPTAVMWVLRKTGLLSDGRISETRERLKNEVEAKVKAEAEKTYDALEKEVATAVQREIDALGEINHL